jgi:FixJ family two-component response regulator
MRYELGRRPLLMVIDDDQSVREALPQLLHESGYEVDTFESAEAFLASGDPGRAKCLIVDVAMPGMSGPELQRELTRRGQSMPVIFITANVDGTMRPRLLEQGAVECLFKPFTERALLAAIGSALRVA